MPDSIVGNEFLPNAHIEKIVYQEVGNRATVQVQVSIYDYIQRAWSLDEKFTSYLSINLAYIAGKQLIDSVKAGNTSLDGAFPIDVSSFPGTEGAHIDIPYSSLEMTEAIVGGISYNKFKRTVNIPLPKQYSDLTFFANTGIKLQDLKDSEMLELSYSTQNYSGPTTGEDVIRDSSKVTTSNAFIDESGDYWSGPVHLHPDKGYMEGSKHRPVPHRRLTLDSEIPNSKIEFSTGLSYGAPPPSISGNLSLNTTSDSILPPKFSAGPNVTRSSIFEEDYTQDNSGNVTGTFIFDLYNLSLEESRVAKTMHKHSVATFERIASNTNIDTISIKRHAIIFSIKRTNAFNLGRELIDTSRPVLIAKSSTNDTRIKETELFRKRNGEIRILSGTRPLHLGEKKIGKIKQLNITLPKNFHTISFTDYEIPSIRGRAFSFSIDITMKDNFLTYVKGILEDLKSNSRKLENFQNVLVAKNVFDGEKFKTSFIKEYYSQYGIEINEDTRTVSSDIDRDKLKNIFIFKAFAVLKEAEELSGLSAQSDSVMAYLNLFSTDLDKIDKAIKYYNKVIFYFKETYKIGSKSAYKKSGMKANRKDRPIIEKNILMKNVYKKPLVPRIGYNFIAEEESDGPNLFALEFFRNRAEKETNKFFKRTPSKSNPFLATLTDEEKETFINISEDKFKNFTPSKIFFGKKQINTTKLDPESMEVEFFRDLKFARAFASSPTENHDPVETEEPESFFSDSRNYLGDSTKFTAAIKLALRKDPTKIRRLRKQAQFFDRSILLQRKGKPVSLDSFDLSAKNNIINKTFQKNIKEIPIQLKALSLLKTDTTNFNVKDLDFDPLANPQTDEVIKQNFLNIGKVKYLEGFKYRNGVPMLNEPIFKEISPSAFEELKTKNVLCHIDSVNLANLTTDSAKDFQVYDKVFTLQSTPEDVIPPAKMADLNPLIESEDQMVDNFTNTILSPVSYSSVIVAQNEKTASIVEGLRTDTASVVSDTTPASPRGPSAPISPQIISTPTVGGGY